MDINSNLLKSYEKEWKTLNDNDKLIQLGKLKMVEDMRMMMEMYSESICRELKINNVESEKDCLEPKQIEKNAPYKDPELISIEEVKQKSIN
tara:strand:+ start:885 stop:1160 length:276 start_codon:yes stop_codon:yes gene_type:complete